jgi:hypothetical protein
MQFCYSWIVPETTQGFTPYLLVDSRVDSSESAQIPAFLASGDDLYN